MRQVPHPRQLFQHYHSMSLSHQQEFQGQAVFLPNHGRHYLKALLLLMSSAIHRSLKINLGAIL
jgi:hypothetical protein